MCGLAGFAGIKGFQTRMALSMALGVGIDGRGGHASGYVSLPKADDGVGVKLARVLGPWEESSPQFQFGAAKGETCMMHARWATTGAKDDVNNAHPFTVKRQGKTVLYGAHNGVLQGTYGSAAKNNRTHTVDSREFLELLADDDLKAINDLTGYGVVTFVRHGSPIVNVVRLSRSSDFLAVSLKGGGIAWASTWDILRKALDFARLEAVNSLPTPDVGVVYAMTPAGVEKTEKEGVKVGTASTWTSWDADEYAYNVVGMGNYSGSNRVRQGHGRSSEDQADWDAWVADKTSTLGYQAWRSEKREERLAIFRAKQLAEDEEIRKNYAMGLCCMYGYQWCKEGSRFRCARCTEEMGRDGYGTESVASSVRAPFFPAGSAQSLPTSPLPRAVVEPMPGNVHPTPISGLKPASDTLPSIQAAKSAEESAGVFLAAELEESLRKFSAGPDVTIQEGETDTLSLAFQDISDEQLDDMTDEQWDELLEKYRATKPDTTKVRVGT